MTYRTYSSLSSAPSRPVATATLAWARPCGRAADRRRLGRHARCGERARNWERVRVRLPEAATETKFAEAGKTGESAQIPMSRTSRCSRSGNDGDRVMRRQPVGRTSRMRQFGLPLRMLMSGVGQRSRRMQKLRVLQMFCVAPKVDHRQIPDRRLKPMRRIPEQCASRFRGQRPREGNPGRSGIPGP